MLHCSMSSKRLKESESCKLTVPLSREEAPSRSTCSYQYSQNLGTSCGSKPSGLWAGLGAAA